MLAASISLPLKFYCVCMQVPKDWFLFVLVVLVVAGDLLIVLLGTVIPSSRLRATRVADVQHPLSYVSTSSRRTTSTILRKY